LCTIVTQTQKGGHREEGKSWQTDTNVSCRLFQGDRCDDFKNIFAEKIGEKMAFLTLITAVQADKKWA
jgi:hypothetical protein